MKRILLFFLVLFFISSCSARKRVLSSVNLNSSVKIPRSEVPNSSSVISKPNYNSTDQYITFFKSKAIHEMKLYGIPASITLAQGILESGSGKGRLAREANNHFGIKCHDWTGPRIYHDDDLSQECFRKYNDPNESYRDHSLFLINRKRYSNLFKYKSTDYKAWAKGLKKAGYATDPKYPQKIISIIERYKLNRYDIYDIKIKNNIQMTEKYINHKVKKGDTLYSISKFYNTTVEYLKLVNKLNSNELSIGQTLIIISN